MSGKDKVLALGLVAFFGVAIVAALTDPYKPEVVGPISQKKWEARYVRR